MKVRIGTRGSKLALVQAEMVASSLRSLGAQVELVRVVTTGDARPPDTAPGEGVFVQAISQAVQAGEVDLGVHSAKDMPLGADSELVVAAYPERADPRDALVTASGDASLASLPEGARVGTDSPRRQGFLRAARPDLRLGGLHGNVDTRLRRLDAAEVDAIVIAAAGLDRLGLGERIDERIEPDTMPPAPAQGALAVEVRADRRELIALVSQLDDARVRAAVKIEREVLLSVGGGCRAPVGALAEVSDNGAGRLLVGGVRPDGAGMRLERLAFGADDASAVAQGAGRRLALEVEFV